jgi:hypothetical protein
MSKHTPSAYLLSHPDAKLIMSKSDPNEVVAIVSNKDNVTVIWMADRGVVEHAYDDPNETAKVTMTVSPEVGEPVEEKVETTAPEAEAPADEGFVVEEPVEKPMATIVKSDDLLDIPVFRDRVNEIIGAGKKKKKYLPKSGLVRLAEIFRKQDGLDVEALMLTLVQIATKRCKDNGRDNWPEICRQMAQHACDNYKQGEAVNEPEDAEEEDIPVTERLQHEYDEAAEKADLNQEAELDPYPCEIWKGTPYYDFAIVCRGEGIYQNFIPLEFFINGLMTVTGAIAGHRITPEFNPTLSSSFYTILLTLIGGIGKGEAFDWSKKVYDGTGMLQQGLRNFKNIGAFWGDFGSARGLIEKFTEHPNILQEYAELSTAIEKFGISGSGTSFLDFNLNAYDKGKLNLSFIKGSKLPANLPDRINNSILGSTTVSRWDGIAAAKNLDTFLQRVNLIATTEIRTVPLLRTPDTEGIQQQVMDRVGLLEEYRLEWKLSAEASEVLLAWHASLQQRIQQAARDGEDPSDVYGRIQVYVHRIIGHLALFLADVPVVNGQPVKPNYIDGNDHPYIRKAEGPDKVWNVEVPADWMHRAILAGEYQIKARGMYRPPEGADTRALVENLIRKWAVRMKYCRWTELKRRANLRRFSNGDLNKCLAGVENSGLVTVKVDPEDPRNQKEWIVVWVGDGMKTRKWAELRSGLKSRWKTKA